MKHQLTMRVDFLRHLAGGTVHIGLRTADDTPVPAMEPGQFVEVAVDKAKVLLNRPFSIFNRTDELLELLVKPLGRGSEALGHYVPGDEIRVIAPLGKGFTLPDAPAKVLLAGGGVGVAPMYYLSAALEAKGIRPVLVYGERTAPDASLKELLSRHADLHICTDDGSEGFHGFVANHPAVAEGDYDFCMVCGPAPMMKSIYNVAKEKNWNTEFSLENKMACGLGACLCCVENTTTGNRCVCSDGPVFNINELPW